MKARFGISVLTSLFMVGLTFQGCGSSSSATGGTGGNRGNGGNPGSGGSNADGGGGSVGPGTGGTTISGTGGFGGGLVGHTQCTDGIDNDGDGRIDLADPECVSPLDNDESSFATGISGDNMDACKQDCFFDGNSGMGDDGCQWELKCDPSNIGAGATASCPYDSTVNNCPRTQSAKCIMNCQSITPNGCDCFGCCVVPGVSHPIRLDPTCTAAKFNDPAACPACTQQTTCMKTCGACQLCIGKTTLEPGCTTTSDGGASDGGAPTPVCPGAQTVCGTNPAVCGAGTICVTGCCVPSIY